MTARRRARHPLRTIFSLLLVAVALAAFLRWDNTSLQTTEFDLRFARLPQGFDGYRAVVLSDLHSTEFGEGNAALFDAVRAAQPEVIFLLGDLADQFRGLPQVTPKPWRTVFAPLRRSISSPATTSGHWAA